MFRFKPKEVSASVTLEAQANSLFRGLSRKQVDPRDRTDAIWCLRDLAQNARQKKRDDFVKRYRPIRSLSDDPIKDRWDTANRLCLIVRALCRAERG